MVKLERRTSAYFVLVSNTNINKNLEYIEVRGRNND